MDDQTTLSPAVATAPAPQKDFSSSYSLLKQSFAIYRKKWKYYLSLLIVPAIVCTASEAVRFDSLLGNNVDFIFVLLSSLVYFIAFVTGVTVTILSLEGDLDIAAIYKRTKNLFPSIFFVAGLSTMAMSGGFTLLYIPGIIIAVWFAFDLNILLSEGIRGFSALFKSREYMRGMWWAMFLRILGTFFFLSIACVIPLAMFSLVAILSFGTSTAYIVLGVVSSLLSCIFIVPMWSIALTLLYYERKKRGDVSFVVTNAKKALVIILGLIGLFAVISPYAIEPVIISGKCMSPTYQTGDYLFANKLDRNFERDDVVYLRHDFNDEPTFFVQRVIGIPGDKVDLHDGHLFVNGVTTTREFTEEYKDASTTNASVSLGEEEYFLACDSWPGFLAASGTPVQSKDIKGKMLYKVGNFFGMLSGK